MNKKIALVFGGSGGIGSKIVKTLASNGIQVCSLYHTNKGNADNIKNVSFYNADLLDSKSLNNAFNNVIKEHNLIDIVIFSVTLPITNKSILEMGWKDFEQHIDIQIKGLFNIIQNLKDQINSGHKTKFIIILTEYCVGKPPTGLSDYITAKYGLMGFAKAAAIELAKYNCTFNMVSPGMVQTDLIKNVPTKLVEIATKTNPLKKIASAEDVANVVLFLASDKSDYLNGVNIMVNGGGVLL